MSKKTNKLLNKKPDVLMLPSELVFPSIIILLASFLFSGMGVPTNICFIFAGSCSVTYFCLTYAGAWKFFARFKDPPKYTRKVLSFSNILENLFTIDLSKERQNKSRSKKVNRGEKHRGK